MFYSFSVVQVPEIPKSDCQSTTLKSDKCGKFKEKTQSIFKTYWWFIDRQ